MKKLLFLLIVFVLLVGMAIGFWVVRTRTGGVAALQVTSVPKASVIFDGKGIGETPFRDNVASGDHTVKISPEGLSLSFDQKLSLLPNVLTVIDRTFSQAGSSGYTLSLLPLSDRNAVQITVISSPSATTVTLDSEIRGITPIAISSVTASDHELIVGKEGYQDKIIRIKAVSGYKLLVNVDLAASISPPPDLSFNEAGAGQPMAGTPTPTATPSAQIATQSAQLVRIGQTPNNFLRVRQEPFLSAKEIARVKLGETFPYLDERPGWFKIRLTDGTEGWVSSQYATKITE